MRNIAGQKRKKKVEKQKVERAAKAEQKRIAKKQAKDKDKCTVQYKHHQARNVESSSSSDEVEEEEMVLDDNPSTDKSGEESNVFYEGTINHCVGCDTCFIGRE